MLFKANKWRESLTVNDKYSSFASRFSPFPFCLQPLSIQTGGGWNHSLSNHLTSTALSLHSIALFVCLPVYNLIHIFCTDTLLLPRSFPLCCFPLNHPQARQLGAPLTLESERVAQNIQWYVCVCVSQTEQLYLAPRDGQEAGRRQDTASIRRQQSRIINKQHLND